ncbi:hypothetical protein LSAT2_004445 [Lamellibrachia satsuma]|nr:hypothetical protein LSAT2_004445 [Lamellibrachia satsuma]
MSSCQPRMVLWMLFGVVLSMVAVAQSIGANPLTCITFDLPRWDGKFRDSRGGYLDINDVKKISCTVAGNKCGLFKDSSRVKIQSFDGNCFYDLSASLWFKGSAGYHWTDLILIGATKCTATCVPICLA